MTGRVFAALIAGAVLPFAFAPYGVWVLAFVCLLVLLTVWRDASPRRAAVLGFAFGLGQFGHGAWWIQVSVHQFGLPLHSFSVTVTFAFVVFMACYPALAGYVTSRLRVRSDVAQSLLVVPAVWTASELLRGWFLTGFPWLLLGYAQIDGPFAVLAPVVGVYGLGFVVVLTAGAAALIVRGGGSERAAGVAALVAVALAMTFIRAEWTRPAGPSVETALVQGAVPQAVKWNRDYRQPSIDLYTELTEPHWGRAIIVWPETAIPAFADEVPDTMNALSVRARASGSALFVGMPTRGADDTQYFNSVVQLGERTGRYDKRHLVPFGEYLPFDRWLRPVLRFLKIPMSDFAAGAAAQAPLSFGAGFGLGVTICYEDAYADEVARDIPDASVLVNVSNDAWFGDSIAPHQHLEIARMRALETGRWLLRSTNTGISAIIDDRGRVTARSVQFEPDVVAGTVVPRTGATPASRYGTHATLGVCVVILALAVHDRRRRVRAGR